MDNLERITTLGKELLRMWVSEQVRLAKERKKADQEKETR